METASAIVIERTNWSETRQVDVILTGAPDLGRRRTGQAFQPNSVTCTLRRDDSAGRTEWRLAGVVAIGPERLKSGGLSTARHSYRSWVGSNLQQLPDWLQTIADEALDKATL